MRLIARPASHTRRTLDQLVAVRQRWGLDGLICPIALLADCTQARDEIVAVDSDVVLDVAGEPAQLGAVGRLEAVLSNAARIGAAAVIVPATSNPLPGSSDAALRRASQTLERVASAIRRSGVEIWIENARDAHASRELWHLADMAGAGPVGVCLNLGRATRGGESASVAIKRLGALLRAVVMPLAAVDGSIGEIDLSLTIDILKGIAFRGFVCVEGCFGAEDDAVCAAAAARLREEIGRPAVPMSAYKGDKNAPRYAQPRSAAGDCSA